MLLATGAIVVVVGAGVFGVFALDRSPADEWQVVFNGLGKGFTRSEQAGSPQYELRPGVARSPDETHAVLVVRRTESRNFELHVRMRTREQLRVGGPPNPWEVAWLVWRYRDPEHFYYLTLKPNGWEVGKRDPSYSGGQRFLSTGSAPRFAVGDAWRTVDIAAKGSAVVVSVDGTQLAQVDDGERPLLLGRVGMYTEDARVEFDEFSITDSSAT